MKFIRTVLYKSKGHISCRGNYKVYSIPGKHVFFGYYDIKQENRAGDKLLVHVLDKNASIGITPVTIAYIDKTNGKFETLTQSNAWSWQQGSRLRWSNKKPDEIYFNNYDNGYCCELWDVNEKKLKRRFTRAFYDIAPDETYALSLNFSRLQRLRSGYGYSNEADATKDIAFPKDDGVFYTDLETDETRLLISLEKLAELNALNNSVQGYINHISICRDSRKFIFFFLWTAADYLPWNNCLYLYDMENEKLILLEDKIIVSLKVYSSIKSN